MNAHGEEDLSEKMPSPAKLICRNFEVAARC
jgi:hypothetical protein